MVGSPAADHALSYPPKTPQELTSLSEKIGVELAGDFLVLVYHPLPGEPERTARGLKACLGAIGSVSLPTLVLQPNADAGGRPITEELKRWVDLKPTRTLHANLPPRIFIELLRRTRALIGNSSAGLIECSVLRTPAINVGPRQRGRERGANVLDVGADAVEVETALKRILADGDIRTRLLRETSPYGNGGTAERVLNNLLDTPTDERLLDKTLTG